MIKPKLNTLYNFNFVIGPLWGEGASAIAALNLYKPIPVAGFMYGEHYETSIDSLVNQELVRNIMFPDSVFRLHEDQVALEELFPDVANALQAQQPADLEFSEAGSASEPKEN